VALGGEGGREEVKGRLSFGKGDVRKVLWRKIGIVMFVGVCMALAFGYCQNRKYVDFN
jgi:hypothetical protein